MITMITRELTITNAKAPLLSVDSNSSTRLKGNLGQQTYSRLRLYYVPNW